MGEVAGKRGLGHQLNDLRRRVVHDLHGALQGAGLVKEGAVLAADVGGLRGPEEGSTVATGGLILQGADVDWHHLFAPHLRSDSCVCANLEIAFQDKCNAISITTGARLLIFRVISQLTNRHYVCAKIRQQNSDPSLASHLVSKARNPLSVLLLIASLKII